MIDKVKLTKEYFGDEINKLFDCLNNTVCGINVNKIFSGPFYIDAKTGEVMPDGDNTKGFYVDFKNIKDDETWVPFVSGANGERRVLLEQLSRSSKSDKGRMTQSYIPSNGTVSKMRGAGVVPKEEYLNPVTKHLQIGQDCFEYTSLHKWTQEKLMFPELSNSEINITRELLSGIGNSTKFLSLIQMNGKTPNSIPIRVTPAELLLLGMMVNEDIHSVHTLIRKKTDNETLSVLSDVIWGNASYTLAAKKISSLERPNVSVIKKMNGLMLRNIHNVGIWYRQHINKVTEDDLGSLRFKHEVLSQIRSWLVPLSGDSERLFNIFINVECPSDLSIFDFEKPKNSIENICNVQINSMNLNDFVRKVILEFSDGALTEVEFKKILMTQGLSEDSKKALMKTLGRSNIESLKAQAINAIKSCGLVASPNFLTNLGIVQTLLPTKSDELRMMLRKVEKNIRGLESQLDETIVALIRSEGVEDKDILKLLNALDLDLDTRDRQGTLLRLRGRIAELLYAAAFGAISYPESRKECIHDALCRSRREIKIRNSKLYLKTFIKPDYILWIKTDCWKEVKKSCGFTDPQFSLLSRDLMSSELEQLKTISEKVSDTTDGLVHITTNTSLQKLISELSNLSRSEKSSDPMDDSTMVCFEVSTAANYFVKKTNEDKKKYGSIALIQKLHPLECVICCHNSTELEGVGPNIKNIIKRTEFTSLARIQRSLLNVLKIGQEISNSSVSQTFNTYDKQEKRIPFEQISEKIPLESVLSCCDKLLEVVIETKDGPFKPFTHSEINILKKELKDPLVYFESGEFEDFCFKTFVKVRCANPNGNLVDVSDIYGYNLRHQSKEWPCLEPLMMHENGLGAASLALKTMHKSMETFDRVPSHSKTLSLPETAAKDRLRLMSKGVKSGLLMRISMSMDESALGICPLEIIYGLNQVPTPHTIDVQSRSERILMFTPGENGGGITESCESVIAEIMKSILAQTYSSNIGVVSDSTSTVNGILRAQKNFSNLSPQSEKKRQMVRSLCKSLMDNDEGLAYIADSVPLITKGQEHRMNLDMTYRHLGYHSGMLPDEIIKGLMESDKLKLKESFEGEPQALGFFKRTIYGTVVKRAQMMNDLFNLMDIKSDMKEILNWLITGYGLVRNTFEEFLDKIMKVLFSEPCWEDECSEGYGIQENFRGFKVDFSMACKHKARQSRDWRKELCPDAEMVGPEVDLLKNGICTSWRLQGAIVFTINSILNIGFSSDPTQISVTQSNRVKDLLGYNITHDDRIKRMLKNEDERQSRSHAFKDVPKLTELYSCILLQECYTCCGDLGDELLTYFKTDFDQIIHEISVNVVVQSLKKITGFVWSVLRKTRMANNLLIPMFLCRLFLKSRTHEKFRLMHKMVLSEMMSVVIMAPKKGHSNYDFVIIRNGESESRFTIQERSIIPLGNGISYLMHLLCNTLMLKCEALMDRENSYLDYLSTSVAQMLQTAEDCIQNSMSALETAEEKCNLTSMLEAVEEIKIDLKDCSPLSIAKLFCYVTKVSIPALIENDQIHNTILGAYRFPVMHAFHRNHSIEFYSKLTELSRTLECQAHELVIRCLSVHALSKKNKIDRNERNLGGCGILNPMTLTSIEDHKDITDAIYGKHYYVRGLMDLIPAKLDVYDAFHKVANKFDDALYECYLSAKHCIDQWRASTSKDFSSFNENDDFLNPCEKCESAVSDYMRLMQIPLVKKSKSQVMEFIEESYSKLATKSIKHTWGDPYFQGCLSDMVSQDANTFQKLCSGVAKSLSISEFTNSNSVIRMFKSDFDPIESQTNQKISILKKLSKKQVVPFGTNIDSSAGMSVNELEELMSYNMDSFKCAENVKTMLRTIVKKAKREKVDLVSDHNGSLGDFSTMISQGMKNVTYVANFIKNQIYFECDSQKSKTIENSLKNVYDFCKVFQILPESVSKFTIKDSEIKGPYYLKKLMGDQTRLQKQLENKMRKDAHKHGRNKANKRRVVLRTKVHEEICSLMEQDDMDELEMFVECVSLKKSIGMNYDKMTDVNSLLKKVLVPHMGEDAVSYIPVENLPKPGKIYMSKVEEVLKKVTNLGKIIKSSTLMDILSQTSSVEEECLKIKKLMMALISEHSSELMCSYTRALIKCYKAPIFELFPSNFTTVGFYSYANKTIADIVDHTMDEKFSSLMITYGPELPYSMKASVSSTFEDYANKRFSTTILALNPKVYDPEEILDSGLIVLMGSLILPSEKLETLRQMRSGIKERYNTNFRSSDRSIYVVTDLIKEGLTTSAWQLAKETIEDPNVFSVASIAPKAQFEGPRDLLVQDVRTKIHTGVAERVSKSILADSPFDLLVHPEAKYQFVATASEHYRAQRNGSVKKSFSASSDETKWGPTHYPLAFARMVSRLRQYNEDEINLLTASCLMGSCKKILFDKDLVDRIISMMTMNGIDIVKMSNRYVFEQKGIEISVEEVIHQLGLESKENVEPIFRNAIMKGKTFMWKISHMGQGIYHATSSLIADFHCRLDFKVFQRLKESNHIPGLKVTLDDDTLLIDKRSSDDSVTFTTYTPVENRDKLLNFFYEFKTATNMFSNIRKSTKHNSDAESCISEVYSTFTMSQEMAPSIKSLCAILTLTPGSTPQQTALQLINLYCTAAEEGATLCEIALASACLWSKLKFLSPERSFVFNQGSPLYCLGKWPSVKFSTIFSDPFREDNLKVVLSHKRFIQMISKGLTSKIQSTDSKVERKSLELLNKWVLEGRVLTEDHLETVSKCNFDLSELDLHDYLNLGLSIGNMTEVHDLSDTRRSLKDTSIWSNPVRVPMSKKIIDMVKSREKIRQLNGELNMTDLLCRLIDGNKKATDEASTRSKLIQSYETQDPTAKSSLDPIRALRNFRQGQLGYYVNIGPYVKSISVTNSQGIQMSSFSSHTSWELKDMKDLVKDFNILQLKMEILMMMKNPNDETVDEVISIERSSDITEKVSGDLIVRKQKIPVKSSVKVTQDLATIALYLLNEKEAIVMNHSLTEDRIVNLLLKLSTSDLMMSVLLCVLCTTWGVSAKVAAKRVEEKVRVNLDYNMADKLVSKLSMERSSDELQLYTFSVLKCICSAHETMGKNEVVVRVKKPVLSEYAVYDAVTYGTIPNRKLDSLTTVSMSGVHEIIKTQKLMLGKLQRDIETSISIACRVKEEFKPMVYNLVIRPKLECLISQFRSESTPMVDIARSILVSGCQVGVKQTTIVESTKVRMSNLRGLSFLVVCPQDKHTGSIPSCSFATVDGIPTLMTNSLSALPQMMAAVSTHTEKNVFSLLPTPITNSQGRARLTTDQVLVDKSFRETTDASRSRVIIKISGPMVDPDVNSPFIGREKILVLKRNRLQLKELLTTSNNPIMEGTFEDVLKESQGEKIHVISEIFGAIKMTSDDIDRISFEIQEALSTSLKNIYYSPQVKEFAMDEIDAQEVITTPIQLYSASIDRSTKVKFSKGRLVQVLGSNNYKLSSLSLLMDRMQKHKSNFGVPFTSLSDYLWLQGNESDPARVMMSTVFGSMDKYHNYLSSTSNSYQNTLQDSNTEFSLSSSILCRELSNGQIKYYLKEQDGQKKTWDPSIEDEMMKVHKTANNCLSTFLRFKIKRVKFSATKKISFVFTIENCANPITEACLITPFLACLFTGVDFSRGLRCTANLYGLKLDSSFSKQTTSDGDESTITEGEFEEDISDPGGDSDEESNYGGYENIRFGMDRF